MAIVHGLKEHKYNLGFQIKLRSRSDPNECYTQCDKPIRDNGRQMCGDDVVGSLQLRQCEDEQGGGNGEDVVGEEECDPQLLPRGHWNRVARDRDVVGWNSSGHRMMYGTMAAQHAIWRHQHPKSCSAKKFLVYKASGSGNGIGSVLHKTTVLLQAALNLDRILVLYPQPGGQWVDAPYCLRTYTLDSCYLEPLSSCSIRDAMGYRKWEDVPWLDAGTYGRNSDRTLKDECVTFGAQFLWAQRGPAGATPTLFHPLLHRGNVSTASYYWWRAQGVAYLVRPNARTLKVLQRRRVEIFQNGSIANGTLSVHVRRGDKWKESTLADDDAYLRAAEWMVRDHADSVQRSIFLSTEDADTVRFFAGVRNWTVRWTSVRRQRSGFQSDAEFVQLVGYDAEFLNSLVSLQLALDCSAWVGMISSNWNRLVDELRSTIRCKFDRPYVDVLVGANITDHDWR